MHGKLHQLNIGLGGVPKNPVASALLTKKGLEGDKHNYHGHGGRSKAVCLYSLECLEVLKQAGFPLFPGALGENFTTEGLDYHQIRIGDVYTVGEEVKIRITEIRAPCGTIRRAYSPNAKKGHGLEAAMWDAEVKKGNTQSPKWGMTGFYAEVLQEGTISKEDLIEKIEL